MIFSPPHWLAGTSLPMKPRLIPVCHINPPVSYYFTIFNRFPSFTFSHLSYFLHQEHTTNISRELPPKWITPFFFLWPKYCVNSQFSRVSKSTAFGGISSSVSFDGVWSIFYKACFRQQFIDNNWINWLHPQYIKEICTFTHYSVLRKKVGHYV